MQARIYQPSKTDGRSRESGVIVVGGDGDGGDSCVAAVTIRMADLDDAERARQ